jgi:hypothetical protein
MNSYVLDLLAIDVQETTVNMFTRGLCTGCLYVDLKYEAIKPSSV